MFMILLHGLIHQSQEAEGHIMTQLLKCWVFIKPTYKMLHVSKAAVCFCVNASHQAWPCDWWVWDSCDYPRKAM